MIKIPSPVNSKSEAQKNVSKYPQKTGLFSRERLATDCLLCGTLTEPQAFLLRGYSRLVCHVAAASVIIRPLKQGEEKKPKIQVFLFKFGPLYIGPFLLQGIIHGDSVNLWLISQICATCCQADWQPGSTQVKAPLSEQPTVMATERWDFLLMAMICNQQE